MVFQPVARSAQSDVLPVPVRQPEQLHTTHQCSVVGESRSYSLLPIHRTIYCHGTTISTSYTFSLLIYKNLKTVDIWLFGLKIAHWLFLSIYTNSAFCF